MAEAILAARALHKHFGGVPATNGVDLDVVSGEVHAVIGPNGAGKTTLIAQLCGELAPDSGEIRFGGKVVTRLPVHRRSRLGLARSYQITSIFHELTVLQNVMLAVQAHSGHSFNVWRKADADDELVAPACAVLRALELDDRADQPAGTLPHGGQRQLEIAMAMATDPKLILLDEPMAGMGPDETARLVCVLQKLKGKLTMLLVEHDMDAVFALADRISVLVYGQIIATGSVDQIRANEAVKRAYLGEEARHA